MGLLELIAGMNTLSLGGHAFTTGETLVSGGNWLSMNW